MIRQRFYHSLFFFLIISIIYFIVPASGIAQSEENPAASFTSSMKLETLRANVEEHVNSAQTENEKQSASAAEIALGGNLKAYFTFRVPSVTVFTKDQVLSYSRALFGLNVLF